MSREDFMRNMVGAIISGGIGQIMQEGNNERQEAPVDPKNLKKAYNIYKKVNKFKVGQLVTWKPGMNNKKWPKPGEPAVVIEVLSEPIIDDREGYSNPFCTEPLDLKLGILRDNEDFMVFLFSSIRMMPFGEGPEEKKVVKGKRKLQIGNE